MVIRQIQIFSSFFFLSICLNNIFVKQIDASAAMMRQQQQKQEQQQVQQQYQRNQRQQQEKQSDSFQKRRRGYLPSTQSSSQQAPPEEIIDLVDIWRELDYSSEIWPLIIDRRPKEITIQEYIKLYRARGVKINKPASHYVGLIDNLLRDRKELLHSPFVDVLRFAAVVEYDFDNGQNRDEMALKLLGESVFRENQKRLGY